MFKKLILNRSLIFILVFTILFNFITITKKVNAEAITMSLGLYTFIKAAVATGVSIGTLIVADKVTDEGIKLYNEWQKFQKSKPNPPDPQDQKNAIANLLGLTAVDYMKDLYSDVKSFFINLGAKPGKNQYFENFSNMDSGQSVQVKIKPSDKYGKSNFTEHFISYEGYSAKIVIISTNYGNRNTIGMSSDFSKVNGHNWRNSRSIVAVSTSRDIPEITISTFIDSKGVGNISVTFGTHVLGRTHFDYYKDKEKIDTDDGINYIIINNSYIITNNESDIIDSYPNIDTLPKEKIDLIATPEGYYKRYTGDSDDLVNDYIDNIPNIQPNDLIDTLPGKFVETDYGIIFVPEGHPIPSPNLNPDPKPDPDPYPDPKPDPDPYSDPYPDIVEEDVEIPKGLGKIIALLKELINWSSRIFNKEEIDKESEPDKPGLFEIPEGLNLEFEPLKNLAIIGKFPFSLPWDLKNAVNLLVSPAEPPKWTVPIVSEEIEIDLSEFESLAFISRSFFTILFIIALVIATRRFIGGA